MKIFLKLLLIILCLCPALAFSLQIPTTAEIMRARTKATSQLAQPLIKEVRGIAGNVLGAELDELLAVGNLMEIIWQLQEHGATERADELREKLLDRLTHSALHSMDTLEGGTSGARLLELADGLQAVFKTEQSGYRDSFNREVALYRFDYLIGTNVFPLTTIRTVDGEEGSVQLFVENSLSAYDVAVAKRDALGLESSPDDSWHSTLAEGITPREARTVRTLRLLSFDGDSPNNPGNYVLPLSGRQIAVDGGLAFSKFVNDDPSWLIDFMRKYPHEYFFDAKIATNMEKHLADIENMLNDNGHNKSLHTIFAGYKSAVADNSMHDSDAQALDQRDAHRVMAEALSRKDWDTADRAAEALLPKLFLPTDDLMMVAKLQRDWQLTEWVHKYFPDFGTEVLDYALSVGDYEFAERLSALGIEPSSSSDDIVN